MNFFDHKGLGSHLLQLCPKVVKHPVYIYTQYIGSRPLERYQHFIILHPAFYKIQPKCLTSYRFSFLTSPRPTSSLPYLTWRTSGHCIGAFRAVNLLFFTVISVASHTKLPSFFSSLTDRLTEWLTDSPTVITWHRFSLWILNVELIFLWSVFSNKSP